MLTIPYLINDFTIPIYPAKIYECFAVGKPTKLFTQVYQAVRESQSAAIEKLRPGVDVKEVDDAARKVIRRHGFEPHGHGTGHGLGLSVHEQPAIAPKAKGILTQGDVVTIEPAVYIPGKLGVRIEDDVLITKTGRRILSRNCR